MRSTPCRPGSAARASRAWQATTLDHAQAYLDRWDAHWADTRIHGTTKRQVAEMFAEERPTLQALVQYMHEQHFIPHAMPIEDLFVPVQ